MDQLKAQFAVVSKYGFWISTSLVLLSTIGVWWLSTSDLEAKNQQQTSKINSAISTVTSVQGELANQPNDLSHREMDLLITNRQNEVLASWKRLYDRQQNILTWPEAELGKDFVDEFRKLLPVEKMVEFPTDPAKELETTLRTRYQRYIKNILPDLAKIADTEWTAEFESTAGIEGGMDMGMGMGGMGMGPGSGPGGAKRDVDITGAEKGPLVQWSNESQTQVLKDLFPWRGSLPSTLDIYYSQENIWILKQLLGIVADMNGEATQPYQAKVHEIKKMAIGKSVKFSQGNISKPGQSSSGMGGSMMDMMGEMMDMDMGMGDMMGGDMGMGTPGTQTIPDPAENRYVNVALEPIAGSDLRSALNSQQPSDAALAVAKRVPVMLSLNMDQRSIPELIATCGSSKLMVEVRQVRMLPKTESNGGMGGMGGEEGMDDMGGMGMGGMGMGMGGMGGGGAAAGEPEDEFPLDMNVEIYGIIYIYNPNDEEKLGIELVDEDTVIDGSAGTTTTGIATTINPDTTAPATPAAASGDNVAPASTTPTTPEASADPNSDGNSDPQPTADDPNATAPEVEPPAAADPDATTPDGTAPAAANGSPPVASNGN